MKYLRFYSTYLLLVLTGGSLIAWSQQASADLAVWSIIGSSQLEGRVNSDVWNVDQYVYVSNSDPGASYGMTVYSGRVNANVELIHDRQGTWRAAFKINDAQAAEAPARGICTSGNIGGNDRGIDCGRPILTGSEGRWFKLRLWRLNASASGGGSTWGGVAHRYVHR